MSDEQANIALTGDSIIARRLPYNEPTNELIELIKEADVAFSNLEVLPNDFTGYPAARSDGAHFAAHSWVLDQLQEMGFNLFSCANNHALDYSIEGLLSTIQQLEKRNVSYAGIGKMLSEARMPVYQDYAGGSVAMIACSSTFFEEQSAGEQSSSVQGRPGVNPLRVETVYEVKKEQLEVLQSIAKDLGLEEQRQEFIQLGFASEEKDSSIFPFIDTNLRATSPLNAKFREAEQPSVKTSPNMQDAHEIGTWVKEAKARADVAIVSLHAHEQGKTREEPAEFIRTFARQMIDEGADVIVGHGPHLLRGMELYREKPIFYSLGNFIGQNDLVYKLPADSYRRFNIDSSLTPSEVFRLRSQDGQKGFPGDELYWQTVMPMCRFENGEVSHIDIVPVKLSHTQKPHKRGKPYLAKGEEAKSIIQKFSNLSRPFGTEIDWNEDMTGTVRF